MLLSFGQGSLRRAVLRRPLPAASSRWLSATSLPVCTGVPAGQQLRYGAPASNKPHPAAKSTPVWLAIWRIWAGFANSQQLRATFRCIYLYTCAHPHCCHPGTAAQTDAILSAHPHRLPTPPPYLRRIRLLPGRGRRCWVANDAAGCPWHSSCKSPRMLQKCNLLITRQLTF